MAAVKNIDVLVKFLEEYVCSTITMKRPKDRDTNDGVDFVNPLAFGMYVPVSERKKTELETHSIPSITVQIIKAERVGSIEKLAVQFILSAWSAGTYESELLIPQIGEDQFGNVVYSRDEHNIEMERNQEGWKSVWNFIDHTIAELEKNEYIDGLRLIKENSIEYGPYMEDDTVVNYHPLYFGWIKCEFENSIVVTHNYSDML